jgi:hypothetical protein
VFVLLSLHPHTHTRTLSGIFRSRLSTLFSSSLYSTASRPLISLRQGSKESPLSRSSHPTDFSSKSRKRNGSASTKAQPLGYLLVSVLALPRVAFNFIRITPRARLASTDSIDGLAPLTPPRTSWARNAEISGTETNIYDSYGFTFKRERGYCSTAKRMSNNKRRADVLFALRLRNQSLDVSFPSYADGQLLSGPPKDDRAFRSSSLPVNFNSLSIFTINI